MTKNTARKKIFDRSLVDKLMKSNQFLEFKSDFPLFRSFCQVFRSIFESALRPLDLYNLLEKYN